MSWGIAVVAVVMWGCRSHRSLEEVAAVQGLAPRDLEAAGAAADPLEAGFLRAVHVFARGQTPRVPMERLTLGAGESADRVVELAPGECVTLLAWAADVAQDVDLVLHGPDGNEVAADRAPDGFPVISGHCAAAGGRYHVDILAARGGGEVAWGIYGRGDESEWASRLAERGDRYAPGGVPEGPPVVATLQESFGTEFPIALLPGRCYAIFAVSDPSITDLDLALHAEDETRVQQDISTDGSPVVAQVCPAEAGSYRLRFRAYSGSGSFAWQLFRTSPVPEGSGEPEGSG